MSRRIWLIALGPALVLAVVVIAAGWTRWKQESYAFHGGELVPLRPAAPIELTDQNGRPFSLKEQEGKVVVLYFGYTSCPDACPTTLSDWISVKEALGQDAARVRFVMVTVDPERDTPERLAQYLAFFDPAFIGLSGTVEQTQALLQAYGVVAVKRQFDDSAAGYLVDHTTSVFVIDTLGRLRLVYAHGTDPKLIAEDLRHLL
ncbi:MAG: electron transporter SenC [Thermomicrobiales bacterium]|nr:MAG: electron transporter SenC [Thermomicrobiales bacterium]